METIAERSMILVKATGEKVPFTIRFGKPYRVNDHEWACPVKAPAVYVCNHDIHGSDSFQALMLAQCFLRQTMQGQVEDGMSFLNPEDESEVDVSGLFVSGD
jgi:hypothetical protein